MADKKSNSSSSSSEKGLKVLTARCGCTYLGDPKTGDSPYRAPMPGMDKKQRTSWCGKVGTAYGADNNCVFV